MNRRSVLIGAGALSAVALTGTLAYARPRLRRHTAIQSEPLALQSATRRLSGNEVSISVRGSTRYIRSNGIPDHAVGQFPNSGNPNAIRAQSYRFEMPVSPEKARRSTPGGMTAFGVAVNGVPLDPGAAEFWEGDSRSGWQYDALGGAVALGLDANYGHVQPNGAYHYHGLPVGLLQNLGWRSGAASPLLGYAADGFPIYAIFAAVDGALQRVRSSYRLKSGNRPGGAGPGGTYDGTFNEDYAYVAGSGDLDANNGAYITSAEYPAGTYAYILTETYPVVPRSFAGTPDSSFRKRR